MYIYIFCYLKLVEKDIPIYFQEVSYHNSFHLFKLVVVILLQMHPYYIFAS